MNKFKYIFLLLMLHLLAACGGGGGSAGSNPNSNNNNSNNGNGNTSTVVVSTPTAADFVAELDKATVTNSGSDSVQLTVTVLDKNRNILADVPVSVSVNSGAVFSATTSKTDASGKFEGKITIGSDKSNRIIAVNVTVNGLVKTLSIAVVNVTSTSTGVVTAASDFIFELDKTSIANSGSDVALLTVKVVDQNRNLVGNVPVAVSVDSDAVFAASGSATNSSGQFTGNITIGGNKSNRTINARITVNNIVKVASVVVTGSQISVTPVPATPEPGKTVTLNLAVTDSAGNPVANVPLTLSGSAGAVGVFTTNLFGVKTMSFVAPSVAGTYDVLVAGSGVSIAKDIQVIGTGGVGITDAVGPISAASLTPQPTSIAPNVAGSTSNRAKLSAKFLTSGNLGLKNMRVRFEILQPNLGAGESISTGTSTVYSDSSGIAEADYISGTRTSPTNGVSIRACYKLSDFSSSSDCPNFVDANLTVAGAALAISITDDNTMQKGLGGISYIKTFLIQVNDAAGVAVQDAVITPSVDITHYGKGYFGGVYPLSGAPDITFQSLPSATTVPKVSETVVTTVPNTSPTQTITTINPATNVWCINEDINRNGFLDTGEDINGNKKIEPVKADIIVSFVSGNKTDKNGQMLLQISYGQNLGRWLAYTLRATTSVAGSEGDRSRSFVTDVLAADLANGSFYDAPYGRGACVSKD